MGTTASMVFLARLLALSLVADGAPLPTGASGVPTLELEGLAGEPADSPAARARSHAGWTGIALRATVPEPDPPAGRAEAGSTDAASEPAPSPGGLSEQLAAVGRQRAALRTTHHVLGIVTWASVLVSATLGTVQFVDSFGAGELAETRCARGDALMGQWNCGVPVLHLSYVFLTTAVYFTTFGLGRAVRVQSGEIGEGSHARRRRAHRALAWTHLAGIAYQIVGGLIFANLGAMGVDEEESFRLRQALFASHLAVGWLTFGALTGSWVSMAGS